MSPLSFVSASSPSSLSYYSLRALPSLQHIKCCSSVDADAFAARAGGTKAWKRMRQRQDNFFAGGDGDELVGKEKRGGIDGEDYDEGDIDPGGSEEGKAQRDGSQAGNDEADDDESDEVC